MADVVSGVEALSRVFPTVEARVLATGVAVAAGLGLAWLVRRGQARLAERASPAVADLVASVLVAVVGALVATAVVGVWGRTEAAVRALAAVNPGPKVAPQVVLTLVLAAAAHVLSGFVRRIVDDVMSETRALTEHQQEVTFRVFQVVLWTGALVVVLGVWEVNLGGLLVGAGFLGIVLGMAARQTLGALLAGFVLMFARPFTIGDWVEIGDQEGIVTDISIVNTRIQTFDGEYVMLPNDMVSGSTITNRTRKGRLRLEVEVGVDYATDVERARTVAAEAMQDVDAILSVPAPKVVTKRFGDSSVVLGCRFWIDKPSARRKWRANTAVVGAVKTAFDSEGVKIPFPQRELAGREEAGGFRVADGQSAPVDAPTTPDGGE